MARWADFERSEPGLAARIREQLEGLHFVYAGTIRRDGTPRISPVEAHFVRGELMLVMTAGTLKARDLLHDPRVVVNSPVTDRADPGAECKLRGRVIEIDDAAHRTATGDAIEAASGWRPPEHWHFFALELE